MILLKPSFTFAVIAVVVFLLPLLDININWEQFFYFITGLSLLLIASYYYNYIVDLKGTIYLKRKAIVFRNHEVTVALLLLFLSKFRITDPYLMLLLWYLFIYLNIYCIVYLNKPTIASISGNTLVYRNFTIKKIEVSELKRIIYHEAEQKISLEFTEGTKNIDFYCKEYNFSELILFVKKLASMPENKSAISDILTNYYFKTE